MEIAHVHVSGVKAELTQRKGERWEIPAGIIGATIRFTFDPEWDGLSKTVVFQGSDQVKDVIGIDGFAVVPQEVVSCAERKLRVGIYGVDKEGKTATPTFWVEGIIKPAAAPSGDASTDNTLPVWAQMEARLTDLEQQYAIEIDASLTEAGCAADAKVVGDRFAALVPLGYLEIDTSLTKENQAADAKAAGDALNGKLPLSGGTMTGPIAMGGNKVTGLGTPTADGDAVSLGYANDAYAMAGYGYGEAVKLLYFNNDADGSLLETALDALLAGMKDGEVKQIAISDSPAMSGCAYYGSVYRHRSDYAVVNVYSYESYGTRAIKTMLGGVWNAWCWDYPPMALGVEYRTTERHNGAVVYTKLVSCGTIAHGASVALGAANIIRFAARATNGTVYPYQIPDSPYWRAVQIQGGSLTMLCGASAAGADTVYCQIWYVK